MPESRAVPGRHQGRRATINLLVAKGLRRGGVQDAQLSHRFCERKKIKWETSPATRVWLQRVGAARTWRLLRIAPSAGR